MGYGAVGREVFKMCSFHFLPFSWESDENLTITQRCLHVSNLLKLHVFPVL